MTKRTFHELHNMAHDSCLFVLIHSLKIKDEACNKPVTYIIDINPNICSWYYGKMYADTRSWKLPAIELKNNILSITLT